MSMYKVIPVGSWDFGMEPSMIMKVSSHGLTGQDRKDFFSKRAGSGMFADLVSKVALGPGDIPIHTIAIGATERYGCFFSGTQVQTFEGLKPIESIGPGELVLTHRNRFRPVSCCFKKKYTGNKTSIEVQGLPEPVVSTENHPFWVIKAEDYTIKDRACSLNSQGPDWTKERSVSKATEKAQFIPASELEVGDYVIVPVNPVDATSEDLPVDQAYAMGLYVAEGCVRRKYSKNKKSKINGLVYALNNTVDIPIVDEMLSFVGRNRRKITPQKSRTSTKGVRLSVYWTELAESCVRLFGSNSHAKKLAPSVFSQSKEWKLKFLAGYFDGDGCVTSGESRYSGTLRANTVSINLVLDIQRLLANLLIPSTISKSYNRESNGCFGKGSLPIYEISIGSAYSNDILNECKRLRPHCHNRIKQSRSWTDGSYSLYCITKINHEQTSGENIFNLEVEDDNTYVTAIASHNSNRNGDGFSLDTCRKHASSFTCKPLRDYVKHAHNGARYFMHHKNDDLEKSFGYVKAAAFNEPMGRIELLIIGNGTKEAAHRNGGFVLPDSVLDELHRGDFVSGSMSCFRDPNFPILTKDSGYKRIADIVVGDFVWTHKGRWQKVTALKNHLYTGETCSLKVRGLPLEFNLTAEHPMLSKVMEGSVAAVGPTAKEAGGSYKTGMLDDVPSDWTHVSHITVGDKLIAVPVAKFPGYAEIEDCDLAAIMGYYTAEGSLTYNSDRASSVIFTCHASDSAVRRIPRIVNNFWPDLTVKIKPKANSPVAVELAIYNTEFAELTRRLCKAGCRSKVIPPEIFNSCREVKLSYLGAWMDGDGWVDKKGGHWSSVNLGLVLQGRDLLLSLGCPSSVYRIRHTKSKGSSPEKPCYEYTLNISNLNIGQLRPYSEKAFDSPRIQVDVANSNRQRVLAPLKDGSYAMSVKSVVHGSVENSMVYNFEVEEDESYSAAGLVSHNCKIAHDICQICNNKAASRKYYCDSDSCVAPDGTRGFGCKEGLTKLLKSGRQQFVENPNPIFFDFSYVGRPADRTAYGGIAREFLNKAASDNSIVKGGAWLAELNGMFADGIRTPSSDYNARQLKLARELADLEKAMDLTEDAHIKLAFSPKVQETLDLNPMGEVGTQKFAGALKALANAGAILTLEDFLAITAPAELKTALKSAALQVRQALPFVFRKLASREDLVELLEHPFAVSPMAVPSLDQKHWAEKVAESRCCCECNLSKRASLAVLRGEKAPANKPLIKQASEDIVVGQLAEKYALYQLATLAVNEKSQSVLTLRAVLAHNRC